MSQLLAANISPTPLFGTIAPPPGITPNIEGLTQLLTNGLRLAMLVAGIYAFLNMIIAGYNFISSGGDAKAIANAWQKIYMSILGLTIIVASFLIAAIVGYLLFGDPLFILRPRIYKPGP